jgi:hypothetical protein
MHSWLLAHCQIIPIDPGNPKATQRPWITFQWLLPTIFHRDAFDI